LSGNGNNGTLVNGVGYNSGNLGSLVFDGVDDYVNILNKDVLNIIGDKTVEMTVKMLIKPTDRNPRLFYKYTDVNNQIQIYAPGANSTRFGSRILDNGINYDRQMSIIPSVNQIYTISIVFISGSGISFYLDGIGISDFGGLSTTFIDSSPDLNLSRWGQVGGSNSNCNIYSVKYYNRALSASEIQQNFNATRSRYGI
jgi:hypothetical protein